MTKPRVRYQRGRWTVERECGCPYSSPNPQRAHDEARWHQHPPILGPRWLPADAVIVGDVCGNSIWTPDSGGSDVRL